MPNVSDTTVPQQSARGSNATKRLIQAAALASALIPLGAVAVDGATISCVSTAVDSGGCSGLGSYAPDGSGGSVSNTWKFYGEFVFNPETEQFERELIYWFTIEGIPLNTFDLDVEDFVTSQVALLDGPALTNFPDAVCLPTYSEGLCGLFEVFVIAEEAPSWEDGYIATINWFTNLDPLSQPPDDGNNYILQAKDEPGGVFNNMLTDTDYDPEPTPDDPALSGKGSSFSTFGAFRTADVPEPGLLLLLGTGLVAAVHRRRRRN